ncbi:helix-turn-helix transcriptional regulator [Rivularia sp. UHCC 0363]|uniref:response regulator transcription factor n=1 Tax=Rivularia sp. UHCC 0363 TaxID=3110244 RepID=UPI002B21124F|nr:helix-turn-helix transcriptional regulator [Rivularia sp. UHCC 0363]MEA5594303.1 helix-turn-helix transcriptional regulator [Rivularia sp. UHCC 0363]
MNNLINQNKASLQALAQSIGLGIIGEFCVQDSKYIIVCFGKNSEDYAEHDLIPSEEADYYSIVGRIEVDDQYCLIVKPKITFKTLEPNITDLLTARELQIAAFTALGYSNKQIANRLQISEWTVSTHLRRSFIKLGVDSRAAMVYRCASLINFILQTEGEV